MNKIQQEQIQQLLSQLQQQNQQLEQQRNQSLIQQTEIDHGLGQMSSLLRAAQLEVHCSPLLIQQNVDGSNFFNRTWAEFKAGFGDVTGNYWLSNDLLHQLTRNGQYKLRFDLQSLNNSQWYRAEYSVFTVGNESTGYQLHVGGFTGNVFSDALTYNDGNKFTTWDRDNSGGNCAVKDGGGFWYNYCALCTINGPRVGCSFDVGFSWRDLTANLWQLKTSRVWLMCRS
jgi:hypothetical protein